MRSLLNRVFITSCLLTISIFILYCDKQESQSTDYTPVVKFDPNRDAAKDIQDAITEAQKAGKRIILDVGGEWCPWCHKLDKFFVDNKDINEFMNEHFVVLKINYSKENKNEDLLSKYPEIPGYPHLFVLDSDGSLLHSQDTGKLEAGDQHDREKVYAFLKAWAKS
jgi:thioredoxin-related protein